MKPLLNQMEPWFDERETQALVNYMTRGGWITEFEETRTFERLVAAEVGARHAVVVNNGTVSLTLALLAAGVGPGDDVIVPNYTMIATPNAARLIGATPVFVDVEPQTLCMSLAGAAATITSRTTALILVTANGRYPRAGIDAFADLCRRYHLAFIEDAAQSLGSRLPDGRHLGTIGDAGSFSFSVPKIITTGQGGAVVCNDDAFAARLRRLKDFGRASGGTDVHDVVGFNFKFTDLQAVIGIVQMGKLAWRLERKKAMMRRYQANLAHVGEVRFFETDLVNTTPWFVDVLCDRRDALATHLRTDGIGTRVMYPPINRQRAYNRPGHFPVSEQVGAHGLWLPSQSQLTDEQIDRVCAAIDAFYHPRPQRSRQELRRVRLRGSV